MKQAKVLTVVERKRLLAVIADDRHGERNRLAVMLSFPIGAPEPFAPPCMRHRFLPPTAGERQGRPLRVCAPQRRLASMGSVLRL